MIFKATKSFFKIELGAYSSVEYSDKLYIQDGGSFKTKRVSDKQMDGFLAVIKEHYPDCFKGLIRTAHEESPWDDDMYICIQFNVLDKGFHIYMG